jgi:hypothetical protein
LEILTNFEGKFFKEADEKPGLDTIYRRRILETNLTTFQIQPEVRQKM